MDHRVSKDMISQGISVTGEKKTEDLGGSQYGSAATPSSLMDAYSSIYKKEEVEQVNELAPLAALAPLATKAIGALGAKAAAAGGAKVLAKKAAVNVAKQAVTDKAVSTASNVLSGNRNEESDHIQKLKDSGLFGEEELKSLTEISADLALKASGEADKKRGKLAAAGDKEGAAEKAKQASRLYAASGEKRKAEPAKQPDRSYPKGKGANYQEK